MQQQGALAQRLRAHSPYALGYAVAAKRGYSPQQRHCFARVFARHATPHPQTGWNTYVTAGYRGDMWNECRLPL